MAQYLPKQKQIEFHERRQASFLFYFFSCVQHTLEKKAHAHAAYRRMHIRIQTKKNKDAHRWKVSWHSWQSFFFFSRFESTQQASITFNHTGHTDDTIFAKTQTD